VGEKNEGFFDSVPFWEFLRRAFSKKKKKIIIK
jgi:hypothetical protein